MIPDDGFDYCCGKTVYNFCMFWWPDYPKNMPKGERATLWIGVGEHACLTPPVIPQIDDDMKHWAKLAKKARKKWQKENQ